MAKAKHLAVVPLERIESRILLIRGHKVILDADLAEFYGVTTANLNKAVGRNSKRFPPDFMFQLTKEEHEALIFQSGTSKKGRGGRRFRPYAFTEHGALMISSVLNTERAEHVSLFIVRAFVKLRQLLATHHELADKLAELERKVAGHDDVIMQLIEAIRSLMAPPPPGPARRIGFGKDKE